MIIVGLTGGIASGKSFVSKYLKRNNYLIHESDNVISLIYKNPNKNFLKLLIKIGLKKSIKKNKIDKKIIRDEIFKSNKIKIILEKYLHKEVEKKRKEFVKKNISEKIIFLDIPLLFEKNLHKKCNTICCMIASLQIREKRALQRPGMTKEIFKRIIKNQVDDKERRLRSNYIINTMLTKNKTILQTKKIIYDILKK
tara:strand:+ start:1025 stop:1615 length:591 start_codon:yes stop_codon:yes gene_type:complete